MDKHMNTIQQSKGPLFSNGELVFSRLVNSVYLMVT
jgi:hypothetical protein